MVGLLCRWTSYQIGPGRAIRTCAEQRAVERRKPYYYDPLDRLSDTALYGTAGIDATSGSWSRAGSVPAPSDSILVTSNTYGDSGLLKDVTDPMGRVTRTEFDAARRKTKTVNNYVDGTPGGGTDDEQDQVVEYTYTNGNMTLLKAKMPSSSDDQSTVYTFGVTRGAGASDSKIASNRLLHTVQYPDSSGGGDVVTYAYNAQSQEVYSSDQGGNVIQTAFDDLGRPTTRKVATLGSGRDGSARAIATAYLARGLPETVTQYSDSAATTVTDQVQYAYDGWGNLTDFTQDVDSVIGASGIAARAVSYVYGKSAPATGAYAICRTDMTLPGSCAVKFTYAGTLAASMSRVDKVQVSSVDVAEYEYAGAGAVTNTKLDEPGAETGVFSSGSTTYPDWDNFGRIRRNDWERVSGAAYTDIGLAYDRNGNITSQTDAIVTQQVTSGSFAAGNHLFDVVYTSDALNRLKKADEGHKSGGSIASSKHTRNEEWTLSQTGNWSNQLLDLNGDGDSSDTDEKNWDSSFNKANEYYAPSTTPSWGPYKPVYDDAGNMTDDGRDYKYIYDGFGRLAEVQKHGSSAIVAQYRYNGLGYRTRWHYDTDADTDVDSSDVWYSFFYDERWRIVATYRGSDSDPKERFVYHNAGLAGRGGSSYIDSVILRDLDDTNGWEHASDGTLETRQYLLQNWRADVVAVIDSKADPIEYVRYSAYGVPYVYAAGDMNRDGVCDSDDEDAWNDLWNSGTGTARASLDVNRDGAVSDSDDLPLVQTQIAAGSWVSSGRGVLSRVGVRKGYAGYEWDPVVSADHVRHRVYLPEMGRWGRRDPAEYVDYSLYNYVRSSPVVAQDPLGLVYLPCRPGMLCAVEGDHPLPEPDCEATETWRACLDCCEASSGNGTISIRCYSQCSNRFPDAAKCDGYSNSALECISCCNGSGIRDRVSCRGACFLIPVRGQLDPCSECEYSYHYSKYRADRHYNDCVRNHIPRVVCANVRREEYANAKREYTGCRAQKCGGLDVAGIY